MKSIYPARWKHLPYLNAIFQIATVVVSILAVAVQRSQNQVIPNWALAQNLASLLANFFLLLTAFVLYKLFVERNEHSARTGLLLVALGFLGLVVGQILMLLSLDQPALIFVWSSYLPIGIGLFLLGKIAKKTKNFPSRTSYFIQISGAALIAFAAGNVLALPFQAFSQVGWGLGLIGVFRSLQENGALISFLAIVIWSIQLGRLLKNRKSMLHGQRKRNEHAR